MNSFKRLISGLSMTLLMYAAIAIGSTVSFSTVSAQDMSDYNEVVGMTADADIAGFGIGGGSGSKCTDMLAFNYPPGNPSLSQANSLVEIDNPVPAVAVNWPDGEGKAARSASVPVGVPDKV